MRSAINDVGQVAVSSGADAFRWGNGRTKDLGQIHARGFFPLCNQQQRLCGGT